MFSILNRDLRQDKKKTEFSKILLIQESILIWINTLAMLVLAYICVFRGYYSELPWLTAMAALPWGAYGISQKAYYEKSKIENSKDGIKYETIMHEILNSKDNSAVG